MKSNLKDESLIELWIECLSVYFRLELGFLLGVEVNFDVWICRTTHVPAGQLHRLVDGYL